MKRFLCGLALGLAAIVTFATVSEATAAPTPEQREELAAAGGAMIKAGAFYKEGKFKDAGKAVEDAQGRIEKLAASGDKQLLSQLGTLYKRLSNAHAMLELEGVKLPELKPLESFAKPDETMPPKPVAGGPDAVSFTKQVAPVLIGRCGGCHVNKASGEFSMANYNELMKGPKGNRVIFPSDVAGSVLIEKIESGEMPPSGNKIPAAELATLKKWITEGAKFDGPDPMVVLTALATGVTPEAGPTVAVMQATGKETISFSRDIAPVLAATCSNCHGDMRPRNNFSLFTFERLLRGGDAGAPVLPGKPADSLLIKKLKGTGGDARMPLNLPPLEDSVIAKIEKWIEEGAKFDAADAKQFIGEVAALAKAQNSTHEQLSADRAKLATDNWKLALPDTESNRVETQNFLLLGNVGENTLAELGAQAEATAPKVAALFKSPADQPLVKGKMTLFAFKLGYDYNELGKMVERRDIPQGSRGHFRYSIVDAYGAMVPPRSDEYSVQGLLAQQMAGVHVAALGRNVPRWFAEGCGRVAASRLAADDARVREWNNQLPQVIGAMTAPDDFLTGKLQQEESDVASYSFIAFLMKDSRRFQILLDGLRKGSDFGQTFSEIYGGSPNQVAQAWVRKPPAPKALKKVSNG